MPELFIGLMSGTSADAIDAVIAEFTPSEARLIAQHSHAFSQSSKAAIQSLFESGHNEIDRLGELSQELAYAYSHCVNELLNIASLPPRAITAIGNHGQTIRHRPQAKYPFTLQIGDAATLALHTGIPVISHFRQADIALGGQGAPLAPGFHQAFFSAQHEYRCVINIGGIANITLLPAQNSHLKVTGWDTGPGNGLMDAWVHKHRQCNYDHQGQCAAKGKVQPVFLSTWLAHPYFARPAPKSTGKEEFTLSWVNEHAKGLPPVDVQATLLELTATTIAQAINPHAPQKAYVCGGGVFNRQLLTRLAQLCPNTHITSTQALGIAPMWVEAAAFAWLAHQFWHRLPGNIPSVTGAQRAAVLGSLTLPA